jgi:hypothetical protein
MVLFSKLGGMNPPGRNINPHISVDCVIFGFSTNQLKVLLIRRTFRDPSGKTIRDHKLPGDFIELDEGLEARPDLESHGHSLAQGNHGT